MKTLGHSLRDFQHPAPTATLIKDVELAHRNGRIDSAERDRLTWALRSGAIIAPIWEDYGLRTNPSTGRPE